MSNEELLDTLPARDVRTFFKSLLEKTAKTVNLSKVCVNIILAELIPSTENELMVNVIIKFTIKDQKGGAEVEYEFKNYRAILNQCANISLREINKTPFDLPCPEYMPNESEIDNMFKEQQRVIIENIKKIMKKAFLYVTTCPSFSQFNTREAVLEKNMNQALLSSLEDRFPNEFNIAGKELEIELEKLFVILYRDTDSIIVKEKGEN